MIRNLLRAVAAVAILAVLALAVAALASRAAGAPLPASRPLRPADLAGCWELSWAGGSGTVHLSAAGDWTEQWEGPEAESAWAGTWQLSPTGDLQVSELQTCSLLDPRARPLAWTARLRRDARGRWDLRDLHGRLTAVSGRACCKRLTGQPVRLRRPGREP